MPSQVITIRDSLLSGVTSFMEFVPALLGGIILLLVGWWVAKLVGKVCERLLARLKLDHVSSRAGLDRFMIGPEGHFSASHGVGILAKWFVFLIFVQAAANVLRMPQVTSIINSVLLFLPNLAVAMVILVVGAYLARYTSGLIREAVARTGVARPALFSLIAQYAIMGFAIIAALNHLGVAVTLVNTLFIGLVASVSLAIGLAFGLGGQHVASEMTRGWYEQGKAASGKLSAVPPVKEPPKTRNA